MATTNSAIEWTDKTWNPVVGCTRASKGCDNCYAATMARRLDYMAQKDLTDGKNPGRKIHYMDTAVKTQSGRIAFNGHINLVPEALNDPFSWKKPSKVFVNSMSDLFHPDVPFEYVDRVFGVMAATPQHTYQILTKRPERMAEYLNFNGRDILVWIEAYNTKLSPELKHTKPAWPLPNVWIGTSVEDQQAADARIPHLVRAPAAVRFLSCEPLLGPVDLTVYLPQPVGESWAQEVMLAWGEDINKIDWIIAGGESGPSARAPHPDWFRSLRDQAQAADVAFFFKQWGEYAPISWREAHESKDKTYCETVDSNGGRVYTQVGHLYGFRDKDDVCMKRVGKKAAGNLLDGVEWNQFPEPVEA